MKDVNFNSIDRKWQKEWEKSRVFEVTENTDKPKYYVLEMYPCPSGTGLHLGHAFNYTLADIIARFMRMNGNSVLYPAGYDSFGLPAENAAIKEGIHPQKYADTAIKHFIEQQKGLGLSYDWSRKIQSHDPEYYKWNQYFFLEFLKKGLAYRKASSVNYCVKCESVLANEQVHDGKCWRHKDTNVIIKNLEQWFVKTTRYAEELLKDVDALDWSERIKAMQKNWIGKSEGAEVMFDVNGQKWLVFTTRIDTLFGVTFLVISAQHSRLGELVTKENKKNVDAFLKKIKSTKQEDADKMEKEGVFTGSYAVHPLTGKKIPIWTGNFVVADYGSGMVMAVPAHDARDFEFAKKYDLEIKPVIGSSEDKNEIQDLLDIEFKKFIDKAKSEKKDFFVMGGFGLRIINGSRYRNNKDIDVCIPKKDFDFWKKYFTSQKYEDYTEEGDTKRDYSKYALYIKNINGKEVEFDVWVLDIGKDGNYFDMEWGKPRTWGISTRDIVQHNYGNIPIKVISKIINFSEVHEKINEKKRAIDICFSFEGDYTGKGKLVNSSDFNGLDSDEAKNHIVKSLESKKLGRFVTQYKLRDWLISRQRYWGTPIPIIYCDNCGTVPVSEKELPVLLPQKVEFGKGNPLLTNEKFLKAKCPRCGKIGRRETDTMDGFVDSSWYFLRFTDSGNNKMPLSPDCVSYWMPVDFYVGGAEHACMHLIYARFFTKALRDLGYVNISEPFTRLFNQGMIHGEDGFVISKSRGNGVDPSDITKKYGADTLRLFLVSMASPDKDFSWSSTGVESMHRFVQRVWNYAHSVKFGKSSSRIEHKVNKAIIDVSREIKGINYNIAVIKLRALFDSFEDEISKYDFGNFLKILSPFAPHIAEELWNKFIDSKTLISVSNWPVADESKINDSIDKAEESFEKTVSDAQNILKIVKDKESKTASHVYLYAIPNEVVLFNRDALSKRLGIEVSVFAVNDKMKFDPENKSGKAKPGRPAIYVV